MPQYSASFWSSAGSNAGFIKTRIRVFPSYWNRDPMFTQEKPWTYNAHIIRYHLCFKAPTIKPFTAVIQFSIKLQIRHKWECVHMPQSRVCWGLSSVHFKSFWELLERKPSGTFADRTASLGWCYSRKSGVERVKASVVTHKTGLTEGVQGAILTIRDYLVVCEGGEGVCFSICHLLPAHRNRNSSVTLFSFYLRHDTLMSLG